MAGRPPGVAPCFAAPTPTLQPLDLVQEISKFSQKALRNSPRNSEIFCIFLFEVDNLTAGCVKAGLKVVRIGRPEATRFDLEKYNLLEMVKDGFLHF